MKDTEDRLETLGEVSNLSQYRSITLLRGSLGEHIKMKFKGKRDLEKGDGTEMK